MEREKILRKAFIKVCKYLQHNPPSYFATDDIAELRACAGAGTYDDGWKQWAQYFINEVLKDEVQPN